MDNSQFNDLVCASLHICWFRLMMAFVSVCCYKDQFHAISNVVRHIEKLQRNSCLSPHKISRCLLSTTTGDYKLHNIHDQLESIWKRKYKSKLPRFKVYSLKHPEKLISGNGVNKGRFGSDSSISSERKIETQLKALDSYFIKLDKKTVEHGSSISTNVFENSGKERKQWMDYSSQVKIGEREANDVNVTGKRSSRLVSLDKYFNQLNSDKVTKMSNSSTSVDSERNITSIPNATIDEYDGKEDLMAEPVSYKDSGSLENPVLFGEKSIQGMQTDDETSDFYLVSFLAAINIAVFLFEIATPVRSSDVELSLPLIYGAKINNLILLGEWWRLLTPMFLHSGFLHIALGSWVLLTFGPQVCRGYGLLTFLLIYILGGICGNLTSFIHTPELTVCGTGPDFALIGAWLVYQYQNKDIMAKEVTEGLFFKALVTTALSFILCSFGRVDNWTHLGAVAAGIIFGILTCPSIQLDNASSKNGQKQGVAIARRQTHPCKSLATFTVSLLLLASLALVYAPHLEILEWDSFL